MLRPWWCRWGNPQRSPCWLPTTAVSTWSGQSCRAYKVQAGGGSVHVWGAFHSGDKSPLVLPDRYLTCEGILRNSLVPFTRQHFGDNNLYQDDNATPHCARIVLEFLQQGKMEQPARLPDCNPHRTYLGWIGMCNHRYGQPALKSWSVPPSPAGQMGINPCRMPGKHATTPGGDFGSSMSQYPILTWHIQNHTNGQHHTKKPPCLPRFARITIQWHLAMFMQPISPISINVITNIPKYTLNKIVHEIHRKT